MSNQISFPPLHDPAPGELPKRRQHLLSEIRREPERSGLLALPQGILPSLNPRFLLPATAALVCAAVAAVILTTTLGGSPQHRATGPFQTPGNGLEDGSGPINWNQPLIDGVTVSSVSAAASALAFRPVTPATSSAGSPSSVQMTDPSSGVAGDRDLALIYDNPSLGGHFWVLERPAGPTTAAVLSQIASECTPANGCESTDSMITLGNGVSALHVTGATEGIIWVQGGVYYDVVGPLGTFTSADAMTVANATANAAGP